MWGGGLLNHSLHSVSEGLSTAPWRPGSEACFKSWAVFDRGDLFSVGLYMVAPCLAEGALCNVTDLSKKKKKKDRKRERDTGRDFGVREASKHQ